MAVKIVCVLFEGMAVEISEILGDVFSLPGSLTIFIVASTESIKRGRARRCRSKDSAFICIVVVSIY